jgi:hypothetical protein
MDLEALLDGLAQLGGVTLQAMFVHDPRGRIDNTSETAVSAWLAAVHRVRPLGVQVYSIDRLPALDRLTPAPPSLLAHIAQRVEQMGIPARVF